jgi:hypothetical protein
VCAYKTVSGRHEWLNGDLMDTVLNFPSDTPLEWYPVSREVNQL